MNGILVVDDDPEVREGLSALLAGIGAVSTAGDGDEALRLTAAERPKLMLLDMAMPGLGGLAVLRSALELQPSLTVWMLTAQDDIKTAKAALEYGARAYFTKPFDVAMLHRQVADCLGRTSSGASEKPWQVAP